ncbi:MAG: nucleotidyltransferase domain-containing protein [Candidatus Aminicenantes bacterium]|nr:nucleotidyltransferase domain-containing protein [Candidatus Aminicenantes bacterium]
MRLLDRERKAIMEAIVRFDDKAEVYLFGSRSDDTKKGGDIDILIISDKLIKSTLFSIEEEIFKKIEEQKIDFILSGKDMKNKFARMIFKKGAIKLWI